MTTTTLQAEAQPKASAETPAGAPANAYTTTAYSAPETFELLRAEWNDLLGRSAFNNLFTTWEWQSSWWAAYQPGELWIVAVRDSAGALVGLAPLFIDHSSPDERVVREVGCVDVTDYLDLLVDQSCPRDVLDCISAHLRSHRDRFDRINLCNLPPQSCAYQQFAASLGQHGFKTSFEQQEVCPIIALPDDWEGYLNLMDKKQRHELRRKLRIAAGQPGLEWYTVGPDHDLAAELDKFLALMAGSTPDKAAFLADAKHTTFFNSVMPLMAERGWLSLHVLTLNGEAIAAYLNFEYDGRVLVYNSGLSLAHGQISPGIVLLAHIIRRAVESDRREFDFLRGNEEYKYRLAAQDRPVYMLKAH
jgi:CelD/BcsL family acetyltransferase involved in cellulose biosynthesis